MLLVLWYHVWEISWLSAPWSWLEFIPETGFIGVQLFFFLSGFVIAYPFIRAQYGGKSAPTWWHFYYRRFIKIWPSYVLSIIVAYAIGYAAIERYGPTPEWQEIASHLLFVHTWWNTTYGSINGVLWTLAVEVEFYAIFPLVWWCFKRSPWITVILMVLASFAWRSWLGACCFTTSMPMYAENLPGYLDIFACGMLCAMLYVRFGAALRRPSTSSGQGDRFRWLMIGLAVAGWIGLVILLEGIYAYRLHPQWQVAGMLYTHALYGFAFVAIAFGSLTAPSWFQLMLANSPLRFLAIISYNLYLYHQMIAREMVEHHFPSFTGDMHYDTHWQVSYTILAFVLTIAQATLVTYLIERPLLRLPDPMSRKAPASGT